MASPGEEGLGKRIASAVDTFRAPDLFNQEPEPDVHEVLIQPAAANARWNGDIRHLTRQSGTESQCGSDQSLGERKQICLDHFRPDPCRSRLAHRLYVLRSPEQ